jgi:16S rRNA processing protein RimM
MTARVPPPLGAATGATGGSAGEALLVLGAVTGAHGIQGWLRVRSFTEPPQALLEYPHWQLRSAGGHLTNCELEDASFDGRTLRVALVGIEDRNAAEALRGREIVVPRSAMPPTAEREYYQHDLLGFVVENLDGVRLGTVSHFLDGVAQPMMAVVGERETWIPAVPLHLRRVLLDERRIVVDWQGDL